MQAYEAGLKPGETRILLSPDSEFLRYFNNPTGRRTGSAPATTGQIRPGAVPNPGPASTPGPAPNPAPAQ